MIHTIDTDMELKGNQPIFEQIASNYQRLIEVGVYPKGTYLPSVREVAIGEGINPATVARAFRLLADQGFVTAIEKKGYLVCFEKESTRKQTLKTMVDEIRNLGYSDQEIMEVLSDD